MQDQEIWHRKWLNNQIGFHLEDVNPLLIKYWPQVNGSRESNVLVPLCGKSEDLIWLAQKHEEVMGVELSQIAVRAFFSEHFYTPTVTFASGSANVSGQHELYQFDEIGIYVGDFFTAPLQSYDHIYDRAALIALPPELRAEYVARLKSLLKEGGNILLVTLDFDPSEKQGPPFSVPKSEVESLFSDCEITHLYRDEADAEHDQIKRGLSRFAEEVWLIKANN